MTCPPLRDETADYVDEVRRRGEALVGCLGTGTRIFEVGMRAAVTEEQHIIALEALAKTGIRMTSNVAAARELGLVPVGTIGARTRAALGRGPGRVSGDARHATRDAQLPTRHL